MDKSIFRTVVIFKYVGVVPGKCFPSCLGNWWHRRERVTMIDGKHSSYMGRAVTHHSSCSLAGTCCTGFCLWGCRGGRELEVRGVVSFWGLARGSEGLDAHVTSWMGERMAAQQMPLMPQQMVLPSPIPHGGWQ